MKLLLVGKSGELCHVILFERYEEFEIIFTCIVRDIGCFRAFCDRYVPSGFTYYDRLF